MDKERNSDLLNKEIAAAVIKKADMFDELVIALEQLYNHWGKPIIEQYEYCILDDAKKALDKAKGVKVDG